MIFANILLVGIYVASIFIFLYCYWGYAYYRKSSARIGMIAASKYYKEMIEADPTKIGYDPRPASVTVVGDSAIVKFNVYNNGKPPIPAGGAMRTYKIVNAYDQCVGGTSKPIRKPTPECQGLLNDDMNRICFYQTTSGLGCMWL